MPSVSPAAARRSRLGKVRLAFLWVPMLVLLVMILAAAGVGFLLPAEYDGAYSLVLPQPPETVWRAVRDFERYPCGAASVRAIERLPDRSGLPCWREDLGRTSFEVCTVEVVEGRRIVRELRDLTVPMQARFTIELRPHGEGTRIEVAQHLAIAGGTWHVPFFRLTMHFLQGARRGAQVYLERLRDGLATG